MAIQYNYADKFDSFLNHSLYKKLKHHQQSFIRKLAFEYRFTSQEFRQITEICRDLTMWNEPDLEQWWWKNNSQQQMSQNDLKTQKKNLMKCLRTYISELKTNPTVYSNQQISVANKEKPTKLKTQHSNNKIFGQCPVASDKTVCCNLYTIDAVQNCIYGCSYCSIQTFYHDEIVFDQDFRQKLNTIELDPNRFYHIGTGQASDSLVWGNRNGNLDALCEFAAKNPNILLEFKTKSDNIRYFLDHKIPENIVCSWSLNTSVIITNEEHQTASLEKRLAAAEAIADQGIHVGFHFHPMIHYKDWETEYLDIAQQIMQSFQAEDVLFVSFGSITMIKPAIKNIRASGISSKILQAELVPDPHGKMTYYDDIKIAMFKKMHEQFEPWWNQVFFYLCMEKASIWEQSFGYVYKDNEAFEEKFGSSTLGRIKIAQTSLEYNNR